MIPAGRRTFDRDGAAQQLEDTGEGELSRAEGEGRSGTAPFPPAEVPDKETSAAAANPILVTRPITPTRPPPDWIGSREPPGARAGQLPGDGRDPDGSACLRPGREGECRSRTRTRSA